MKVVGGTAFDFNAALHAWDKQAQQTAEKLRQLAREAGELAAGLRANKMYGAAELMDRRAEALLCAALVAEGRGMQT